MALYISNYGGYKARVIAEDIISYAQLRLAEMTKNDQIEFLNSNNVNNLFDQLEQDNKNKRSRKALDIIDGEEEEGDQNV